MYFVICLEFRISNLEFDLVCLAIPGQIINIKGKQAIVQYPGQSQPALIGETGINVGDFVIVQMGIIVKKLNKTEAKAALKAWEA